MAWGTDVMMLGRARPRARRAALGQAEESAAAVVVSPTEWTYLLGSYAGSWGGGAGVGYIASRTPRGALRGGLAASGLWGVGEALYRAREREWWLTGMFVLLGAGSLAAAWKR